MNRDIAKNCAVCTSENNKNMPVEQKLFMGKEDLHDLACFLALDAAVEILGAIERVSSTPWDELRSLDNILESDPDENAVEVDVQDAPVYSTCYELAYRTDTVELPENYHGSYAVDADDEVDLSYSAGSDQAMVEAAELYERQLDGEVFANNWKVAVDWKIGMEYVYPSAEVGERVENYKLSLGYGVRFLLKTIKDLTS